MKRYLVPLVGAIFWISAIGLFLAAFISGPVLGAYDKATFELVLAWIASGVSSERLFG
jgi:hypothetical protein